MTNVTIRKAAKDARVPHWKIADALGMTEFTFSRKLRHELQEAETERILQTIQQLSQEDNHE